VVSGKHHRASPSAGLQVDIFGNAALNHIILDKWFIYLTDCRLHGSKDNRRFPPGRIYVIRCLHLMTKIFYQTPVRALLKAAAREVGPPVRQTTSGWRLITFDI
jgi:hypothetical protein